MGLGVSQTGQTETLGSPASDEVAESASYTHALRVGSPSPVASSPLLPR